MEIQQWINIVFGVSAFSISLLIKIVWTAIRSLQKSSRHLVKEINELKVVVAGSYVKRDEFSETSSVIHRKLDTILTTLGGKADKG